MHNHKQTRKLIREHISNIRSAYNEMGNHPWNSVVMAALELYVDKNKNLLKYWWKQRHKTTN